MDDSLFSELLDSVHEGGAILRGEKEASRAFTLESPDISSLNGKKGDAQRLLPSMREKGD